MARSKPITDVNTIVEAFGAIRAEYYAAKSGRFRPRPKGLPSTGAGADYHYRDEAQYLYMMEWARNADRNNMVVGQAVRRLVNNVVQDGFRLDPQTGDDEANRIIADRFVTWAEDPEQCHSTREHTLTKQTKMALRAMIIDGDEWPIVLKRGAVEHIEAHRIQTPMRTQTIPATSRNVIHGVLRDAEGVHQEVWVSRELNPTEQIRKVADMVVYPIRDKIGRRQVLHVYDPKRFSQTRGVTALAPPIDAIGYHDDIQFAKLVQQQVVSCFAILRERAETYTGGQPGQRGERTDTTRSDGSTRRIEGIAPGMEVTGAPGETLKGFSPAVPNPEWFQHAHLILTIIAVNLDLPVAVLLLDPSETNFSGWRGAIDQARIGWRDMQSTLIEQWYRPLMRIRIDQMIATDEIVYALAKKLGPAIYRHKWTPPSWPYIEPVKDATGDKIIIANRLNSRRGVLAKRGLDIDDVDAEIIADNARTITMAIEQANAINATSPGAGVTWQNLLGMEAPQSLSETAGQTQQGDQNNG